MHTINDNAVDYKVICPKIINVKIYHMKYFGHEIFTIYDTTAVTLE